MDEAIRFNFKNTSSLQSLAVETVGNEISITCQDGMMGISFLSTDIEELRKLGAFLIEAANNADDLEFDHPMGQS